MAHFLIWCKLNKDFTKHQVPTDVINLRTSSTTNTESKVNGKAAVGCSLVDDGHQQETIGLDVTLIISTITLLNVI